MYLRFCSINDTVWSDGSGGRRNRRSFVGLSMSSGLRQRFGELRRTVLHPVQSPSMVAKRFIGGHGGDDAEETFKWRNITIACVVGLIPMMFNTLSRDDDHHHGEERPAYSYLRIRNKEFPWGPNGLFEYDD